MQATLALTAAVQLRSVDGAACAPPVHMRRQVTYAASSYEGAASSRICHTCQC
jgi:hypothetical protein